MVNTSVLKKITDTNREKLIGHMVGRKINDIYNKIDYSTEKIALEVQNLKGKGVNDVSFKLKNGEIFGVAGLVGSGRTEMVRLIFGADKKRIWKHIY